MDPDFPQQAHARTAPTGQPPGQPRRRTAFWLLVLALGLVWSLALTASGRAAPTRTAPQATIPPTIQPSELGLVFVNAAEQLASPQRIQRGVQAGARMDRFPIYWDRVEPAAGQFNWSAQDAALLANQAQGLDTLAILLGTPAQYRSARSGSQPTPAIGGSFVRWPGQRRAQASCNPWDGPPPPSGLYNPIFADGTDEPGPGKAVNPDNYWAYFVQQAVERYRPGGVAGLNVRHWEIWNEPDLCKFWSGTPQEYARLLKVAYLVIKQVDPEATVLWGGLAHFANGQFLDDLLAALQADPMAQEHDGFFDAAASHHYSLSYLGYAYTAKIRAALTAAGWGDKPIWITESGVPVCDDYPGPACPSPWRATPEEQAAYIWQNLAYTRLAGGGPIFHFMLHDDCGNVVAENSPDGFGLVKNEASSFCSPAHAEPRLAYTAYQLASQYFPGTELVWADILDGATRRVSFYHPGSNQRRLLVWNIGTEPITGTVPATGSQAQLIRLDGSQSTLTPVDGRYELPLPGATNRNWPNEEGGYDPGIYGEPFLLIETDELPPKTSVSPLPELSPPSFTVSWLAQDWGAGVASAALWVREDEGSWQLWQDGLPAQGSTVFTGTLEHRYQFALQATDKAGHRQDALAPQAETLVSPEALRVTAAGRVIDLRGFAAAGVEVQIGTAITTTDDGGQFSLRVERGSWDVAVEGTVVNRQREFQEDATLLLLHVPGENRVQNGAFESGLEGWQVSGSSPLAVEQQPGTGDHALRLATGFVPNPGVPGEEGSEGGNSTVSQKLQVPEGHPYLVFAYQVESQESEPGHDKFEVILAQEGKPANYVLVQETSRPWQYTFLDLGAYAGQEITLLFNVYQSSPQRPTTARLDLVTVADAGPPPVFPNSLFLPLVQR